MSPSFPRQTQGVVLRNTNPNPVDLRLRGYHPLWQSFPEHFDFTDEDAVGPYNPTSPTGFPAGFGLDSSLFARCYSGNPSWFLFLPLLGCFRSGGSRSHGVPQVSPVAGSPIRVSSGSKAACAYPGHYRSLPRPSSAPEPSHPSGGVACQTYSGTHTRLAFEGLCTVLIASIHSYGCPLQPFTSKH